jgi:hypothetical protein
VAQILRALVDQGRSPDDAAALIYRGTRPSQRTVAGTIGELLTLVTTAAPENGEAAVLVIGDVIRLRETRAMVRRAAAVRQTHHHHAIADRARELADALENLGAEAILAPTFRLAPPEDPEAVDRAAASLDRYDWVVFESAAAVARFLSAVTRGPHDLRAFGRTAICAVGPSTEDQLRAGGLKPDVVIPELNVESISDAMAAHAPRRRPIGPRGQTRITNAMSSPMPSRAAAPQ